MPKLPIPVILAYPDPAATAYLEELLQSLELNLQFYAAHSVDELYAAVGQLQDRFIAISELFWEGTDGSDILLSLALAYPRGAWIVLSDGPVDEYLPRDFPAPRIQGFAETEALINLFSDLTEDLRQQQFGPYQLIDFAGQTRYGQIYSANQPAIKRDISVTVPHLHSSPEDLARFKASAAAQARNSFPSIYSIYEESEIHGRRVVCAEPIAGPSLFQFYLEGATFDSRLIAKIIHQTASALQHLHDHNIPHPRIKAKHITLAENGVIKIHNTALPDDEAIPDPMEEVVLLADIVSPFIDNDGETEPRLTELIEAMRAGSVDLATVSQTANVIDIDLAPVKVVPERQQAKKAAEEVQKARKSFWIWAMAAGGGLTAFLIAMTIYVLNTFILVNPGTDFKEMMEVPSGPVFNHRTQELETVKGFLMDEYEVTIGQYEKFLKAVAGTDPKPLMPPEYDYEKPNFLPKDWKAMIEAVRKKKVYMGEHIDRDFPIFNIDYADAYAYAKWAGKRLPTELEWMRAAAGDASYKLPWGNDPDPTRANTGADRETTTDGKSPASLDGFRGPAPVNYHGKTDVSPFGIKGMAGNVSEWVTVSPELGPPKGGDGAQRGGNHGYPVLVTNQKRLNYSLFTRQPWLGFRCVKDLP